MPWIERWGNAAAIFGEILLAIGRAIARKFAGAPVVIPRRKTFYGADEIGVREPAGNLVTFAVQTAAS